MYKAENNFLTEELDRKYNYGITSINTHSTVIAENAAGQETRLRNWGTFRKEYQLNYTVKNSNEINELRDFFDFCSGSFKAFRFYDATNCLALEDEVKTSWKGRNYVRLQRVIQINNEEFVKTLPSFDNNDFLSSDIVQDLVQEVDKVAGKIYIKKDGVSSKKVSVNAKNFTVDLTNLTNEELNKVKKQLKFGYMYLQNDVVEYELEVNFFDENNKIVYFLDKGVFKNNYDLFVNFYSSKTFNIIKPVVFLYIVRFKEDELSVKMRDFDIFETDCELIEVLQED